MAAPKPFYDKNDNVLSCTVTDEDGVADTGATVTATTVDSAGQPKESNLTLVHDAAGVYKVTPVEGEYDLGEHYTAQITIEGSQGEDGYIELDFKVQTRKA